MHQIEEDIIDAEVVEEIEIDTLTPRQIQIAAVRALLVLMEADPELPWPYSVGEKIQWIMLRDTIGAARVVKTIGGKWEKNDPNDSDFDANNLNMQTVWHGVKLQVLVDRSDVCEKKVIGKRVERKPVVVREAVSEMRDVEVDVVQFECRSLLGVAAQKAFNELEAM